MIWFYLLSGLFLGWSLGANDAANIFGTAVATRMVKFRSAALIAAVFVILGAVISGAGTTETLGELGAVNALAGSFTVALAAALAVTWMTRLRLPVSTTQAIVGAIIGWNIFSGTPTDFQSLTKIVVSWIISPVLAGLLAALFYTLARFTVLQWRVHLLHRDAYNRLALIVIGAFGAYSLGANNIANVVGVFVPAVPFQNIHLGAVLTITGTQQLFFLGALAIGIGIYTYSYRVMQTVGDDLLKLTPITAFIVVFAQSLVLFLFASKGLQQWLLLHGLPALPLVPLSSSQAVVGAILGLAIARGARGIRFRVLGRIASGWVTAPLIAGFISLLSLFFAQNLFEQEVVAEEPYELSAEVLAYLQEKGISTQPLTPLEGRTYRYPGEFRESLGQQEDFNEMELWRIFKAARIDTFRIDTTRVNKRLMSPEQYQSFRQLQGKTFHHSWQIEAALARLHPAWDTEQSDSVLARRQLRELLEMIYYSCRISRNM